MADDGEGAADEALANVNLSRAELRQYVLERLGVTGGIRASIIAGFDDLLGAFASTVRLEYHERLRQRGYRLRRRRKIVLK